MKPACMTDDEWADWNEPILGRRPGGHPCFDCPLDFHREQRAAGTCDGFPRHDGGRRPTYQPEEATARRRQSWRESNARIRARRRGVAA